MPAENNSDNFATPIHLNGTYANPPSFQSWVEPPSFLVPSSWRSLLNWRFRTQNDSKLPKEEVLDETLPVTTPTFPTGSALGATWLGHATMHVNIEGLSLLTDPVWARHASPISWAFCQRYRRPPCEIEQLPEIHVVVISHNHFDHLDFSAIAKLGARFPQIRWFVPAGLAGTIQAATGTAANIHELSWGQSFEFEASGGSRSSKGDAKFRIWSVPAQHWSMRTLFDRNKSLWSGWMVEGPAGRKFFFTGDTGFCEEEFRKVGQRFGPIDLAAIPIGCYSPRWFMHPQHIDPEEAVKIHQLCRAKKSIGVHWGTYAMGSAEAYMEPRDRLRQEVEAKGLAADEFITLGHGQSWRVEDDEQRERREN